MAAIKRLTVMAMLASALTAPAVEDTMTGIFSERIRSLQVHIDGDPFGLPVVVLGDAGRILIEFDQLSDDREFFRYSLTHCNANWQPSGLTESEYLDGFNEGVIEDYAFSEATTVHYVHYSLTIPNEQVMPTISGNYLLKIYPESNPDSTYLQCRFMVSEQTAPVSVDVTDQTDVDYRKSHQQVSVAVDTERAEVEDPFNDMLIVVGQNGRLDNEKAFRQPLRMSGTTAIFEHRPELVFEAGNEYRRFETVSDYYPGMGVERIEYFEPYYHYTLFPDVARDGMPYAYDSTQGGRYFVRCSGADDSNVEADYGVVHFSLEIPELPGTMIFMDGDFTQRRFDANSQMQYNHATGRYERAMLLKQGSYNYQYLAVPPGARRGYTSEIEGDMYQTSNQYFVRVYHRRRGERYDRLIGVGLGFSNSAY